MKTIRSASAIACLLIALALPLGAAITIEIEKDYQAKSPEQLDIEVTQADTKKVRKGSSHRIEMVAKAKVLAVTKSSGGLAKGDVIEIRYSVPDFSKSPEPGAYPSLVKKGVRYKAYLSVKDAKGKRCEPAALSGSFARIKKGG